MVARIHPLRQASRYRTRRRRPARWWGWRSNPGVAQHHGSAAQRYGPAAAAESSMRCQLGVVVTGLAWAPNHQRRGPPRPRMDKIVSGANGTGATGRSAHPRSNRRVSIPRPASVTSSSIPAYTFTAIISSSISAPLLTPPAPRPCCGCAGDRRHPGAGGDARQNGEEQHLGPPRWLLARELPPAHRRGTARGSGEGGSDCGGSEEGGDAGGGEGGREA